MDTIKSKIKIFLSRALRERELKDDDDLFQLGLMHSLFAIQLILFIEKECGIELEDTDLDLEKIKTISQIVQLVKQKQQIVN